MPSDLGVNQTIILGLLLFGPRTLLFWLVAPAVLKVEIEIKIKLPPGTETADFRRGMAVQTLPREGAAKVQIKGDLKYREV